MTKITNATIKDDVYVTIDDEFEQIRTSLGMYISKLGTEGALHLIKEMTNNEFDEAVNPLALSQEFDIVFDEVEQSVSTIDYSRGIPFEMLVDVCTKKHSSTKFDRDDNRMKDQAGRNGEPYYAVIKSFYILGREIWSVVKYHIVLNFSEKRYYGYKMEMVEYLYN